MSLRWSDACPTTCSGRHVIRRPHQHLALQPRVGVDPAGDAEVEDLQDARVPADHQVGGLDVAVDDAVPVGVGQADADLLHQGDPPRQGQRRRAVDELAEGFTGDELHRDERLILVGADVVDRDDVGVLEPGRQPRLAQEPLAQVVAVDPQDLEGDLALGHWVERQIEHAHATVRNALTELVAADCRGWRGQCADYTHRPPRRPCQAAGRRQSKESSPCSDALPSSSWPPRSRSAGARARPRTPRPRGRPPRVPSRWPASATPARRPPKGTPPLRPRLAPRQTGPAARKRPGTPWPPAAAPPARARSCGGSRAAPRSTFSAPSTCPTTASWRCRRPSSRRSARRRRSTPRSRWIAPPRWASWAR